MYRINHPRDSSSGITDLRVNRLTKWSVALRRGVGFSVGPTGVSGVSPGQAFFACRLDLDINTAVDFQSQLSREQLPQIFQELVDLGNEIAGEGDIP